MNKDVSAHKELDRERIAENYLNRILMYEILRKYVVFSKTFKIVSTVSQYKRKT